jgi:hypothetical protein
MTRAACRLGAPQAAPTSAPGVEDVTCLYATPPPKRAKNAYLVFLARHEPEVAKEHQGWSRNQVMNVVAAMWKKVSPEDKVDPRLGLM